MDDEPDKPKGWGSLAFILAGLVVLFIFASLSTGR